MMRCSRMRRSLFPWRSERVTRRPKSIRTRSGRRCPWAPGNHWLDRRVLDRRAEPVANDIARKRGELQARRALLSELGISERVLRNRVSWEMVPVDDRARL